MAEPPKTSEYVTLVSNDGYEFKILRSAACIAGTIQKALDPMCALPNSHTLSLSLIPLCEFCSSSALEQKKLMIVYTAGFRETTQNRVDLPTIK